MGQLARISRHQIDLGLTFGRSGSMDCLEVKLPVGKAARSQGSS